MISSEFLIFGPVQTGPVQTNFDQIISAKTAAHYTI